MAQSLERRVAALEQQMAELKAALANSNGPREKDWRSTIGIFTDKPGVLQIFEDAMKLREIDRARARRRYAKKRRVKS